MCPSNENYILSALLCNGNFYISKNNLYTRKVIYEAHYSVKLKMYNKRNECLDLFFLQRYGKIYQDRLNMSNVR